MVDEITGMGFDTIEISHGLKVSLLPGLQKAFKEGRMKVCGLHNFCPSPVELLIDAPDAYEFTSHRALERARALKLTLRRRYVCRCMNYTFVLVLNLLA